MIAAVGQIVRTRGNGRAFRSIGLQQGSIVWHGATNHLKGNELAIVVGAGPYALRTYIITSSRIVWTWREDLR